jgi:acyl-CoA dehydrogenase
MSESRKPVEQASERLFKVNSTEAVARNAERGQWPKALWDVFERSGLGRIALPEVSGGSGDWEDALALLRMAGRHFVPVPVAESVLGLWLLNEAGMALVDGPITLGPVLSSEPFDLKRCDNGWQVLGTMEMAGSIHASRPLVALARDESGRSFAVRLDPRHAAIEARVNVAFEERSLVTFCGPGVVDVGAVESVTPGRWRSLGAATRVAMMTGALERVLELALEYVKERQQFGRSLGKFQAIQQQLAVLAGEVAASVMAFEAVSRSFGIPLFEIEVAIAKARVGEAAGVGAAIGHQVHGAMGFTHEHSLHLFTKRLWAWRDEYGNEREWQTVLGRFAARARSTALWNMLATETV